MVANHYEPSWTSTGKILDIDTQLGRIDEWAEKALTLCDTVKGSDGVPLKHTYFYPGEQYDYRLLRVMAEMQARGLGEVEVHLHHGVETPDTDQNLRASLIQFRDILASEHKCLSRWSRSSEPMYGFVHGNWALANSAGGRFCGVDSEMQILAETGCYADFTLPSIYSRAQVPRINAIYECGLPLSAPSPHRKGPGLRVGSAPALPILLTGPTILDWRSARRWPPVPRIDDGVLDNKYGLSMARARRWMDAGISVEGRPEWLFIKLYGHAFFPGDQDVLIGETARRFFSSLYEYGEETGEFKVHFATAREAFNIAMAAVNGQQGDPHHYRSFLLHPIMGSPASEPQFCWNGEVGAHDGGFAARLDGVGAAAGAPPFKAGSDSLVAIQDPAVLRSDLNSRSIEQIDHIAQPGPRQLPLRASRTHRSSRLRRSGRIRRSSQLVRAMCRVLLAHPGGLPDTSLFTLMEEEITLTAEELGHCPSRPLLRRFELAAMRGAVAPLKAKWMVEQADKWWLTSEGRAALDRYQDPEEFLRQAARLSRRGWLSLFMPGLYWVVCSIKFRLTIEMQLIRRVGLVHLFEKGFRIGTHWQKVLPIQEPRRASSGVLELDNGCSLAGFLEGRDVPYREGGHTIYLAPVWARQVFPELMASYPDNAGIKIVKNPGTARESYVYSGHTKISWIHRSLTYSHRHLVLVAGLLSSHGMGPRILDLLELKINGEIVTAYVMQHIDGREPTVDECRAGITRLRALEKQRLLKVIVPHGFDDSDFACPSCNGNALVDSSGAFRYVDFQNFHFVDYGAYLKRVARQAQQASHFGDQSFLRGGRYLYQSVPGVRLHGKRNTEQRELEFRALLDAAGLTVKDKIVLDFGCNVGMMIALYLKLGADWCHGWDLPHIVEHTDKLLLALGCTRFSTTGVKLDRASDVAADIGPFLRSRLDGCVISYLAVRANLGWLDALSRIPWSFLIYESHEHETPEQFEADLQQLRQTVDFETRATRVYRDGDCDPRFLAVLVRRPGR
jgi:hypothetical protein